MTSRDDTIERTMTRMEELRPKILDTTLRNSLLNTQFREKTHSHIRVVDELPSVLLEKLSTGERMLLDPLPALEEEPKDEQTDSFRQAVAEFENTDGAYHEALAKIEEMALPEAEKEGRVEEAHRDLKDRVRTHLGLPPRHTDHRTVKLDEHARIHGINPDYDMPRPEDTHEDGRHVDHRIQTLMLSERLERRCTNIRSRGRAYEQETGVQVLQCAIGFLEWQDSTSDRIALSPLTLLPVNLSQKKTSQGLEFWVEASDSLMGNAVLKHKLLNEYGIELPQPDTEALDIEYHLAEIEALKPKSFRVWRIRRFVAIGVWQAMSLAMYEDLNPESWRLPDDALISRFLGGRELSSGDMGQFADEHEVDDPEIESQVPLLIADADSSQFSAMVDVMRGEDIALEGPPGTGKSQTIVNTIAASLASGKKVLFVAEKLAALDVVRSRLEAMGLGEFLMNLQASQNTRQQVRDSVVQRLDLRASHTRDPHGLDEKIQEFIEVRNALADYIRLIGLEFRKTGLTYHQILGQAIVAQATLENLSTELRRLSLPNVADLSGHQLDQLYRDCQDYADMVSRMGNRVSDWSFIDCGPLDRFRRDNLLDMADEARQTLEAFLQAHQSFSSLGMPILEVSTASQLQADLREQGPLLDQVDLDLVERLLPATARQTLSDFRQCLVDIEALLPRLELLSDPYSPNAVPQLDRLLTGLDRLGLTYLDDTLLGDQVAAYRRQENHYDTMSEGLERLIRFQPQLAHLPLRLILTILTVLRDTPSHILEQRGQHVISETEIHALPAIEAQIAIIETEREALDVTFDMSVATEIQSLSGHLTQLRTKGAFSFLSGALRQTRKALKGMLREPASYSDSKMLEALPPLIDHLQRVKAFVEDSQYSQFTWFRGVKTDTATFRKRIDYQQRARTLAREEGQSVISLVLLDEHPEILIGMRALAEQLDALWLSDDILDGTYQDLEQLRQETRQAREQVETQVTELREASTYLAPIDKPISRQVLDDTRNNLIAWQEARDWAAHHDAGSLLEAHFDGPDTTSSVAARELSLVDWLIGYPDTLHLPLLTAWRQAPEALRETLETYLARHATHKEHVAALVDETRVAVDQWGFDPAGYAGVDPLRRMAQDAEGLDHYALRNTQRVRLERWRVTPLVLALDHQEITAEDFLDTVRAVVAMTLARAIYDIHGQHLSRYRGQKLDDLRARLADLDREIIRLNRDRLRHQLLANAHPPQGNGSVGKRIKVSELTDLALLKNEAKKQKGFISVRDLTARAGTALREIKPCWMMSPLTVAKYLPKAEGLFDLVIIDEGSQMRPENALGALLRARHSMTAGDTKQLPPSNFFRNVGQGDDDEDEDTVQEESILDLANLTLNCRRQLRWHYRSRHENLIAFCNRQMYQDDLVVFPTARADDPRLGVKLVPIDNATYHKSCNSKEAKVMVDHILRHMSEQPERSLGVVTLNKAQQTLLEDEYHAMLQTSTVAQNFEKYWDEARHGLEGFFIKNLENVQGDERDVIFIGTVFGPDPDSGKVYNRFGPLIGMAGKRRLNVLFTRAKEQIVTFTSMEPNDIRADPETSPGAHMLKQWLEYAATGQLDRGIENGAEPDSDFERHVISVIQAMGFEAVPQVGVQGFFIDIGIRHPDYPYGFLLGVECDGASYHSSRSARDRDRLRQEILESKGWHLHRIWSTDWFTDAIGEKEKLQTAIEARLDEAVRQMPTSEDFTPEQGDDDNSSVIQFGQTEESETQRRLFT
ncbi:DUF4011 domain-containing protein [Billgrantia diversa]|uniref:DUF4011 domain-containing protein n=1 Tax=Halomonas sp. MCCC 1A13316 TaxID=2733487 RepID=UPI0018A67AB2|nr:DUF4011 domain-containing protein [Halomonas sp. MCCC 1A13316]QOR40228.1 DUF4011 domain-containing protein [Halomonas sp. MCCC 1A13316]